MEDYDYGYESPFNNSLTEMEHEELFRELETAPLERCREIAKMLLTKIPKMGYAKYDSSFGDNRVCECGHPYYRHFDTYDQMSPIGCKYCRCYAFVEKDTDREKWKTLNSEC
jgi:hypothetical protein